MKVTERRIVRQDWYEADTKTGWDSDGWMFNNWDAMGDTWTVVEYILQDKFGNPFIAVAEREVEV
jgi:hypothetical protein